GELGLVDEEGAEHHEPALREVDDACRPIDHDEAERDERVDRPEGQAVLEQVEELRHEAYILSMRSRNCSAACCRRTFCVAVRAPVSSRSTGMRSKARICSVSAS